MQGRVLVVQEVAEELVEVQRAAENMRPTIPAIASKLSRSTVLRQLEDHHLLDSPGAGVP